MGLSFPDLSRPETLDLRYLGKLSRPALSFMKALLKVDPKDRLKDDKALEHPYFEGLHAPESSPPPLEEHFPSPNAS